MIRGIHHIAISTRDLERAVDFYCRLLGFEKVFEGGWSVGYESADMITGLKDSSARMAMLSGGNAIIELFHYTSPTPTTGEPRRAVCDHGITHICLEVVGIDAEYERLKEMGMEFHCPPQDFGKGIKATYGRDPDGNVIELQEIADPEHPMALRGRGTMSGSR